MKIVVLWISQWVLSYNFDESLNLVDEFYFQEKNPNIEVWLKEIYMSQRQQIGIVWQFLGGKPSSSPWT